MCGLNYLADFYSNQARYAEAQLLYERALVICERAFGPDHPNAAQSLVGPASLYGDQGRKAEAGVLFERALAIRERVFVADHPEVVEIRNALDALRASIAATQPSDPTA